MIGTFGLAGNLMTILVLRRIDSNVMFNKLLMSLGKQNCRVLAKRSNMSLCIHFFDMIPLGCLERKRAPKLHINRSFENTYVILTLEVE